VVSQTLAVIAGFVVFGILVLPLFAVVPGTSFPQILAFSLLLGTLAAATSPSTTIAVITETQSEGRNTDLVLSTAVVKDFVVIGFFAFALSVSHALVMPGEGLGTTFLWHLFMEVGGSLLLGTAIGGLIILYLRYVKRELAVFILGIAFFTYEISHAYGFHPLMICLLAGFIVQNLSSQGDSLITALEKVSTPVYVVFFAISGASLDLSALQQGWLLAVLCIVWRGALKFGGTYAGSRISGEPRLFQRLGWAGFISQAGVALGMAIEVDHAFPVWGKTFKALVLGVIALNQVIGPVLLQKFLIRSGEAGRKEPAGEWMRRQPETKD
jgi:Kef-type K+ transport system membrane component KefB